MILSFDMDHSNCLMLVFTYITPHNQATSWNGPRSILALQPGYAGTGYYGVCCDSPYLQTFALSIISHGDDLRSRSSLDFEFLGHPSGRNRNLVQARIDASMVC